MFVALHDPVIFILWFSLAFEVVFFYSRFSHRLFMLQSVEGFLNIAVFLTVGIWNTFGKSLVLE